MLTPPTVAVIGGGQLARMMQESAVALGISLRALVEASEGKRMLTAAEKRKLTPKKLRIERAAELLDMVSLPRSVKGLSVAPQILFSTFHTVSPCRTKYT